MTRTLFGSVAALTLVAALATPVSASWEPVWHGTPAFSIRAAAVDDDGHVYVTGFARSPWVVVLAKYDEDGMRRWVRIWRSHARFYEQAIAHDVAVSPDGRDVFVVGATVNDVGEARQPRVWAYSATGSLRWTRRSADAPHGEWVAAAPTTAGVVVAGAFGDLVRYDRHGVERWHRSFLRVRGDVCQDVTDVEIGGGAMFLVGYLDRTPTCNDSEGGPILNDADVVLQRRALTGRIAWSTVRTDAARANDVATSVDVAGRRVFVAGEADARGWLQRLTRHGRVVWTRAWTSERPIELSISPWKVVYVLNDHQDGGAWLVLREFSMVGGLAERRRVGLAPDEVGSALATGTGRTLIVAASVFAGSSDLWRMPP